MTKSNEQTNGTPPPLISNYIEIRGGEDLG